jgi:outer membrane protease
LESIGKNGVEKPYRYKATFVENKVTPRLDLINLIFKRYLTIHLTDNHWNKKLKYGLTIENSGVYLVRGFSNKSFYKQHDT